MPKPTLFSQLFHILQAEPDPVPPSPDYFLFLLGTDTKFTPRPTVTRDYVRGETLSYAAQAMVSLLDEAGERATTDATSALSYTAPSVDVVDGPTTFGSEVGERIAQSIFLVLHAVSSGKKTLQISGHSRGAVEAILVLHELKRIKEALRRDPAKTLRAILLETPDPLTRAALVRVFNAENFVLRTTGAVDVESPALRAQLLTKLDALQIHPFLIDPVPGDTVLCIPGITWDDHRFYDDLDYPHQELLLLTSERSAGFYPILPKKVTPTLIPGHHGTASGNAFDQQLKDVPAGLGDARIVQDLVLLKLFYFWQRALGHPLPARALELEHPDLDRILSQFLHLPSVAERQNELVACYFKVNTNQAVFDHFTTTAYKRLWPEPVSKTENHRSVHARGKAYQSMKSIVATLPDGIVNLEHAMLHLSRRFSSLENAMGSTLLKQIQAVTATLKDLVKEARGEVVREGEPTLLSILQDDETEKFFFNGLSALVDSMSQSYINNHLSPGDKEILITAIGNPFKILAQAIADQGIADGYTKLFVTCRDLLQTGIISTMQNHHRSLKDQLKELEQQMKIFLESKDEVSSIYTKFLNRLNEIQSPNARSIYTVLSAVSPINLESIRDAFTVQNEWIDDIKDITPEVRETLRTEVFSDVLSKLEPYLTSARSEEDYLSEMAQLHQRLKEVHTAYPNLVLFLGDKNLNFEQENLARQQQRIIFAAGKLLKEKDYNLRRCPDDLDPAFYALAKNQAIALGAPSPEVEDLQDSIADLQRHELVAKQRTIDVQAEKEAIAFSSIHQSLLPATTQYLHYLRQEASQFIPGLDLSDYTQDLPDLVLDSKKARAYAQVKNKFDKARTLYAALMDVERNHLPSARIQVFAALLKSCQDDLSLHRDPTWKVFCKVCMTVLAVLATGIVPGLLGLLTYSHLKDKSPLFFGQSQGKQFVERVSPVVAPRFGG
jgi:hypothetical protein